MSNYADCPLAEGALAMSQEYCGQPLPPSAVEDLGGWTRLAAHARELAGSPVLPVVSALVARDVVPGDAEAAGALDAVADAILATGQPTIFADSVDSLLASAVATQVTGNKLATGLEPLGAAYLARKDRDRPADLLSATALETLTRLVAGGYGSHFALLALLDRFREPLAAPMARSVIRSVSTAVDIWPEAAQLIGVVRAVGGLDPVEGADSALAAEVESDVSWVLGMAALLSALRAATLTDMRPHLGEASTYLEVAATTHDRPDARPMLGIVDALRTLVTGILDSDPASAMSGQPLSADKFIEVRDQVKRFAVDSSGLDHWFGDRKAATLGAWARLADDLDELRAQFSKDGFYQAEVVINALLDIYVSSRTFQVGGRDADIDGVQGIIKPIIEHGFAFNSSHLSNLDEYTAELAHEAADRDDQALDEKLKAAQMILRAARLAARGGETLGKVDSGAESVPLPPLIGRLVQPGSPDASLIGQLTPSTLAAIEDRLDHVADRRRHLNLVQRQLFDRLRELVAQCPDYQGDVVPVVDELIILLISFVASRSSGQSDHYKYLYDPRANEGSIHEDLYNFLLSSLADRVEYEVSHTGGGRVDLRLQFDDFSVHIEVKVDRTQLPMNDRTAYLKQAATYQGNDIRIGFLVALRHRAFDPTGPPPHIETLISHTAFPVEGDPERRHLLLVALPGSRVPPSRSR